MKVQSLARLFISACALFVTVLVPMRADTVLYSTGFENPPFTTGPISGQQQWAVFGTGNAAGVENVFAKTGSQAVEVIPALTSGQTGPYHQDLTGGPVVDLSADLYLASSSTQTSWQFAGLGAGLAGYLGGIDIAQNGTITLITAGLPTAGTFSRDAWHHVDLLFDITTQTYNFSIDGTQLASNLPFCGSNSGCTGAPLTYGDGFFDTFGGVANENDIGYMDNYAVTLVSGVPEPATGALLVMAGLLAGAAGRIGAGRALRRATRTWAKAEGRVGPNQS